MCLSGDVFNSAMDNWLECLLRELLAPAKPGSESIAEDSRCELTMLCHLWIDHFLSPYHKHPPAAAEYAVMAISDIVVLGLLGYDVDLWDKILGLAAIISEAKCEGDQQVKAMEFLTLVGLRLRAAENRWRPARGVIASLDFDRDLLNPNDQVA